MKKMGVQQKEIPAIQVIIRTQEGNFVFDDPQVSKVNMMGQESYQVVGNPRFEEFSDKVEINQDDIKTVMDQTGVSEKIARETLIETNGDLAEAIMKLKE